MRRGVAGEVKCTAATMGKASIFSNNCCRVAAVPLAAGAATSGRNTLGERVAHRVRRNAAGAPLCFNLAAMHAGYELSSATTAPGGAADDVSSR